MTYGLFGRISAQPGKREELIGILLQASELLRANDGCIYSLIGTSDGPDDVWVVEAWTDEQAHDRSLEPEDVRALILQARPLIADMGDQRVLELRGGKGL